MKLRQFSTKRNFRDLGGYKTKDNKTIKSGLFYRCGALSYLNEQELEELKKLNINGIIDFRTKKECDSNPDPIIEGINYIQHSGLETKGGDQIDFSPTGMSQIGEDGIKQLQLLTQYYIDIPYDNVALHLFFDEIKKNNVPILFHCHSGKDRTGVAAMLLLGLLNADKQTIIEDYLLSNEYCKEKLDEQFKENDDEIKKHPIRKQLLQMQHGVLVDIGVAVYDELINKYKTIENYFIKEYNYTDQDILDIRERYTY